MMKRLKKWMNSLVESVSYGEMEVISFGMSSNSSVGNIGIMNYMISSMDIHTSETFTNEDK